MDPTIQKFLIGLQPTLDKARKIADEATGAIDKLEGSFLGHIIGALPWVGAVVSAANVLDELIDAVDTTVDSFANPTGSAPAVPQAIAGPGGAQLADTASPSIHGK